MSYYNSTNEDHATCMQELEKSETKKEIIKQFFLTHPGQLFTPFDVKRESGVDSPIWAVRRAITDLTGDGWLINTGLKKRADLGKNNFLWTLAPLDAEGNPMPRRLKKKEALLDVLTILMRKLKEDSTERPEIVYSDDQAKKYQETIKSIIVANGYNDLLPLIQNL